MAIARGRLEWAQTAALATDLRHAFTGEARDPAEMIPDAFKPPPPPPRVMTPEQAARENRAAWLILDTFFQQWGR